MFYLFNCNFVDLITFSYLQGKIRAPLKRFARRERSIDIGRVICLDLIYRNYYMNVYSNVYRNFWSFFIIEGPSTKFLINWFLLENVLQNKWHQNVNRELPWHGFKTMLIHLIFVIRRVFCLCGIIKLNIANLYQIIDLVVWFLY